MGWKRCRGPLFVIASSLVGAISVLCSQFAKAPDGSLRIGWLSGQIGCVAGAVILPSLSAWLARRSEIDALTQSRLELNSGLDPLVRKLGEMAGATTKLEREPLRAEIMTMVIAAAHTILGKSGLTRSCYFALNPGPPRELRPTSNHGGRPGSPRSTFTQGTPAGNAAIELVETNDYLLWPDIKKKQPPGWDAKRDRDYRSFISVAVVADNVGYGMLTVDSKNPKDFDRLDVDLLRVLAGLLAASLAL